MIRRSLLALAALLAAAPAAAGDREWRSLTVAIADLDLSTNAGVVELERRVGRAVDRICDGDRDCRKGAWASTWDQAQAAIARDRWMRRLAAERQAEIAACGWAGCRAAVAYRPPPPPPPAATVVVVNVGCPPPTQVQVYTYTR